MQQQYCEWVEYDTAFGFVLGLVELNDIVPPGQSLSHDVAHYSSSDTHAHFITFAGTLDSFPIASSFVNFSLTVPNEF